MLRTSVGRVAVVGVALGVLSAPSAARAQPDVGGLVGELTRHIRHLVDQRGGSGRVEHVERLTKIVKVGPSGQLDLANIAGAIVVTGGGGDEVRIEAVKRGRGATEAEARAQLDLVAVEIVERPGRVEVRTRYPEGERRVNARVDYTVTVPAGIRVILRSISGNIRATGVKGGLDAETISGDVIVADGANPQRAKTVSGRIELDGVARADLVDLSSISGDIVARRSTVRRVQASTVSGRVTLTDVACDAASLKALSGEVAFAGPLAKAGRYEFKSHSGDVRLTLAGDAGFELDARTFSGRIDSDLPITIVGMGGSRARDRAVRGTVGDGSAFVEVTTFSGSVVIRRR